MNARRILPVTLALALAATAPASHAAKSYGSAATLSAGSASAASTAPASATLKEGLRALDRRDMATALSARQRLAGGSLERKVLAWSIALRGRGASAATLADIAHDLPNWPGDDTIRANIERALVAEKTNGAALRVAFSQAEPESVTGAIALSRAHLAAEDKRAARATIAPFWTNEILTGSQEAAVWSSLRSVLTRDDHRARVEMLMSRERFNGAKRIAGSAGMTRLVAARAAVERKQRGAKNALAAIPASQRNSATHILSQARYLRMRDRISQASALLQKVDPADIHPNAADEFWTEQRIVASLLLAAGKPDRAYRTVRRAAPNSNRKRMDAAFFAGWLALRKIGDSKTAGRHFAQLVQLAGTPISKSRAHYWLGRAAGKSGGEHFARAARYDSTFYGQLAARELGRKSLTISNPRPTKTDRATFPRLELVQAIDKLESAGHPNRARMVYRHLARHLSEPGQLALLAAKAERKGDHQLGLQVGKIAIRRGFSADVLAWPVGAIPLNTKTSGAGLPLAYAVARQESTFQVDARSSANALGLLQLLPTTAARTAKSIGIGYSKSRLTSDAAYNARLGTAYLDQQMKRFGGSLPLVLAAYNAGPSRAVDWLERNGDPRGASLYDAIDWVEAIPYGETRNYVQRVMENLQVYRARISKSPLTLDADLRAGRR